MNRLFLLGIGIAMGILVSCTDKDKIPKGVLAPQKMEKVLWDIIQAERFTANFVKDSAKNIKAENFKLYAQVFSIHNISKDQFIKSYKFYMSRPDIARNMFDSLTVKANRRREEMYKPKTPASGKAKSDSSKPFQPKPVKPQTTPAPVQKPVLTNPKLKPGRLPLNRLKRDSLIRHIQKQP